MGLRGPAPKPSAIAAADGNPGHRPINRSEPKALSGEPTMPRDLDKAAKRIWKETVAVLSTVAGLLATADADILAQYSRTLAKQQLLESAMKAEIARRVKVFDKTVTSEEEIRAEVLLKYENRILRHQRQAQQLNDRLGLNAAARSRMHIEGPVAVPPPADPRQAGLFGNTRSGPQLVAV